jgi:GlpG protein
MLCHTIGFEQVHAWFHFPDMTDADQHWQLWRWISPALIHYTWLHIVFNVMWWFLLGRIIEFHHQSWRLLLLFFTAAIIPNLAQYLVTGVDFGGLSGVVYSLFGYVWVYGHLRPGEGLHVSMTVMVQILAWLVLGFSGWLDSWVMMANAAHLGGLLVGVFFAIYYATHPNADHT